MQPGDREQDNARHTATCQKFPNAHAFGNASSTHPTFSYQPKPATRAPLGEISGNKPKKIELTPVQRGFIEDAVQFSASFSKVAEIINCGKTTILDTLRLTSERHNGESKSRPSRPQKWDARLERRILRLVRLFSKWTYR